MKQFGLSYRMTMRFEAAAELALLQVDPRPNHVIMPISNTPAKAILPRGWEGSVAPFTACFRVGSPLSIDGLLADFKGLAPTCRAFAFWSGPPHGGGERVVSDDGGRVDTAFYAEQFAKAGGAAAVVVLQELARVENAALLRLRQHEGRLAALPGLRRPPRQLVDLFGLGAVEHLALVVVAGARVEQHPDLRRGVLGLPHHALHAGARRVRRRGRAAAAALAVAATDAAAAAAAAAAARVKEGRRRRRLSRSFGACGPF